ncbi:hypothetical protein N7447_005981 [Penicillium robsamsonii]|uniref:uncharacterized protein n=1 Tax=Penicillium robsamsonii TaxID=1792511 RepID=UPI0025483BA2|nr:uncharacterized protein N7447_005981 [Penicillium robsamsonii]KAJ5823641.1 hypothetical protein N7447_005981 [Penicillium robsamsonii]
MMSGLQNIQISCEGQVPSHRYRRSVVDYALISLRMAIEQAPLKHLHTLSLLSIHPGAALYLRPALGFGAPPGTCKRRSQIRKLTVHMTSFGHEPGQLTDHLKLLHAYLGSFSSLQRLRGPLTPVACNRASPQQRSQREANSSLSLEMRVALTTIEIQTFSADGADQCDNGRVAGGVLYPGAPEYSARVKSQKRAPQRQLGRCKRAVDTTQRKQWMEARSARHQHRGCADSIEYSGSQPEAITERDLCFTAAKEPEDVGKLGESTVPNTRAAVAVGGPDHMKRLLRSAVFSWR